MHTDRQTYIQTDGWIDSQADMKKKKKTKRKQKENEKKEKKYKFGFNMLVENHILTKISYFLEKLFRRLQMTKKVSRKHTPFCFVLSVFF